MSKKRVLFFTSTRADYGILQDLMRQVNEHPSLELQTLVTGAHLSSSHGASLAEIINDGMPISERVEIDVLSNSGVGTAKSTGLAIIGFADAITRLSPDMIVLLGDRFETMAMSQAAMFLRVPVAHIHGGEVSLGSIDDPIRHSITKMSDLHFVTCRDHRRRVIQLGESPSRVFDVGSLSVEKIEKQVLFSRDEINRMFDVSPCQKICMVSMHPATASCESIIECAKNIIKTLDKHPDFKIFISYSNLEPGGEGLNQFWKDFAHHQKDRVVLQESFGWKRHLSLMKYASLMLGNSSSGIIEAASFKLPVVNIGNRQKGRICSDNVIHSDECFEGISAAVKKALSSNFKQQISDLVNLYYRPKSSKNIIDQLLLWEPQKECSFYDLEGNW
ncbi:UDP-N-acetylglucosamine 2-epimerase [Alphaproteobacteria bacterium]|nr:UDP-N-acetylglucosamine 2-epimerase [Alphaproteobacteria bacterium]